MHTTTRNPIQNCHRTKHSMSGTNLSLLLNSATDYSSCLFAVPPSIYTILIKQLFWELPIPTVQSQRRRGLRAPGHWHLPSVTATPRSQGPAPARIKQSRAGWNDTAGIKPTGHDSKLGDKGASGGRGQDMQHAPQNVNKTPDKSNKSYWQTH